MRHIDFLKLTHNIEENERHATLPFLKFDTWHWGPLVKGPSWPSDNMAQYCDLDPQGPAGLSRSTKVKWRWPVLWHQTALCWPSGNGRGGHLLTTETGGSSTVSAHGGNLHSGLTVILSVMAYTETNTLSTMRLELLTRYFETSFSRESSLLGKNLKLIGALLNWKSEFKNWDKIYYLSKPMPSPCHS